MRSIVILMGSKSDLPFVDQIVAALDALGIHAELRIASAHKSARYLLDALAAYEARGDVGAYITVAGRSNALSGMVDANVTAPVIACPPYSDKYAGSDLYSSLRMPSGVAPAVVLEPASAALLAAKILATGDPELRARIASAQRAQTETLIAADNELAAARDR
ncbi:MAG: AIR carboxylase family protein [Anaerolineae bacterium]|nr:AIR carboxylase family protein [Anaerolineae bacterium]